MLYVVIVLTGMLLTLLSLLVTRAVLFKAADDAAVAPPVPVGGDSDGVAQRLAGAIRYHTVALAEQEKIDASQYYGLHEYLKTSYPHVAAALSWETVADYSLLLTWKGKGARSPIALLAHMDVVPVTPGTEEDWSHGAFEGVVDGTHVWGRGAMDMKGHLICVLEAVESLLAEGFEPEGDVYLCFGHNEEIVSTPGSGARAMMELLGQRGVQLDFIIDQGGVVMPGEELLGIKGLMAVVGTAEKGYMDVRLSCTQNGSHSSQPPKMTALDILSRAAVRLESHPLPPRLIGTVESMLAVAGRRLSLGKRLILANIWFFRPLLVRAMEEKPITNAMVRTTATVTMANGSPALNVLPQQAELTVNLRILPGETMQGTLKQVEKIVNDDRVKMELLQGREPSAESPQYSRGYQLIKNTLRSMYPGIIVSPYLMVGGTDSCLYEPVCKNIYRIAPFLVSNEDMSTTHGANERISIENLARGVAFFKQVLVANNEE